MSKSPWRRVLTPLVAASLLAAGVGIATVIEPAPAAAIVCSVVTPCYTFSIVMTGTGQAEVTAPGGIDCVLTGTKLTGVCSARFYGGFVIDLDIASLSYTCTYAQAGTACGDEQLSQFTMPARAYEYDINVAYQQAISVQVQKNGTGSGRVISTTYPSIDCGTVCVGSQPGYITDTFEATADAGSVFAGWNMPCSGPSPFCSFASHSTTLVVATFDKVATPPPTPSPTLKPTPTPTAAPTRTPPASGSPPPGSTATPGPRQTPTGPPAAGPSSPPPPTPGDTLDTGASPAASPSADAGPGDTAGATTGATATNGPTDTGAPLVTAGSSGGGGSPPWLALGLVLLVVVVAAAGLAARARMGRPKA